MKKNQNNNKKSTRGIYLTDKEIETLRFACIEWWDMMEGGDSESIEVVENCMENGLGSALYKLSEGTGGEHLFECYIETE